MPLTKRDLVGAEKILAHSIKWDIDPDFETKTEIQAALKGVQVLGRMYVRLEEDQELLREHLERGEAGKILVEDDWVRMKKAADRIKLMQELLGDD